MFDERSSLGLVKLRSKQVSQQLASMFEEITNNDYDDLTLPLPESPTRTLTAFLANGTRYDFYQLRFQRN